MMIKRLIFKNEIVSDTQPHAAGGCCLPAEMSWPVDNTGTAMLHILTIPLYWIKDGVDGFISVFAPYDLLDTFKHWDLLVADDINPSKIILHKNDGIARNEFFKIISPPRAVDILITKDIDNSKNFDSKIQGIPAWLQDEDVIDGYRCVFSINGDDVDIAFHEESGIFSDGVVYGFIKDDCNISEQVGLVTFQFT